MKIVQFVHGLSMGGAETLVKNYAVLMHEAGEDVTVLCLSNHNSPYDAELHEKGIKVVYIHENLHMGGGGNIFYRALRKFATYTYIRYFFRKHKPDIIHFHLGLSNFLKFARLPKTTKIFYTHHYNADLWLNDPKLRYDLNNMKWLIAHYPVQIIALHEQMRDTINKAFNITNTIVLNNGIDMQRFRNAKPREVVRDELGIPRDAIVIGHVGRFAPVKNHEFLVKIFKAIKSRMHNAFLLIIAGGGGGYEEEIVRLISELRLEDSCMILHNRTDIPDLMRAMNIMIFPSHNEGQPVTLIEAQAAGINVLASMAVNEEVLMSNHSERMSLSDSPELWAQKAIIMCNNDAPNEFRNLEKWDIRQQVKTLLEYYRKA